MKQIWQVKTNRDLTHLIENRVIQHFEPGCSTAVSSNVTYRLGKIRDLGLLKGEWLDCGCADGGYTLAMVGLGAEKAIGVDPLEERIIQARERERNQRLISRRLDIDPPDLRDGQRLARLVAARRDQGHRVAH